MPIINKRWSGSSFKTGATFRRWTGSEWKTGATVRVWTGSDWIPSLKFSAEGGTMFIQGEYTYHVFMDIGEWPLYVKGEPHKIEWVIFGGGGGTNTGNIYTGGGGAATLNVMPPSPGYELSKGVYTIRVGAGGAGGAGSPGGSGSPASNGGNSEIIGIPISMSRGGGATAMVGGSGGGNSHLSPVRVTPANKTPNTGGVLTYANTGGSRVTEATWFDGTTMWYYGGGGGGGAGSSGGGGSGSQPDGGNGMLPPGNWYKSPGTPLGVVCGGGAGAWNVSNNIPRGGSGGGGSAGQAGAANTGSGAGGGGYPARGGSGAVLIRYLTPK